MDLLVVVGGEGLVHGGGVGDHHQLDAPGERVIAGVTAAAVGVLSGHHEPVDAVYPAGGVQVRLGERGVVALGHQDVACLRRQGVDDSGSKELPGHGVLAEHREFEVAGLVRVVAVDHQPVVAAAGHPRQGGYRLDDLLGGGG